MTVDAICGKSREEVTKLIAGPGVYICDHCIRLGYDIVSDEQEVGSADGAGRAMPPFGTFSGRARAAVVEAQQAARELRHNSLGTEHLLLGLLAAADGALAELFSSHGLHADGVRSSVTQLVGPSQGHVVAAPPFTPRALRSLVLAGEQASGLGHDGVDTAHLVLGLLAEGHGLAAQLLQAAGIRLEDVQTIARSG